MPLPNIFGKSIFKTDVGNEQFSARLEFSMTKKFIVKLFSEIHIQHDDLQKLHTPFFFKLLDNFFNILNF